MKKEVKEPSILKKKMKGRNNSEEKHEFSMSLQKNMFKWKRKETRNKCYFLTSKRYIILLDLFSIQDQDIPSNSKPILNSERFLTISYVKSRIN